MSKKENGCDNRYLLLAETIVVRLRKNIHSFSESPHVLRKSIQKLGNFVTCFYTNMFVFKPIEENFCQQKCLLQIKEEFQKFFEKVLVRRPESLLNRLLHYRNNKFSKTASESCKIPVDFLEKFHPPVICHSLASKKARTSRLSKWGILNPYNIFTTSKVSIFQQVIRLIHS